MSTVVCICAMEACSGAVPLSNAPGLQIRSTYRKPAPGLDPRSGMLSATACRVVSPRDPAQTDCHRSNCGCQVSNNQNLRTRILGWSVKYEAASSTTTRTVFEVIAGLANRKRAIKPALGCVQPQSDPELYLGCPGPLWYIVARRNANGHGLAPTRSSRPGVQSRSAHGPVEGSRWYRRYVAMSPRSLLKGRPETAKS